MQSKMLHALLIENEPDDAKLIRLAIAASDNVLGLPEAAGGDGWEDLRNRQWREALSTVQARQY